MLNNSVEINDLIKNNKMNKKINTIDAKESLMMNKVEETRVKADKILKNMSLNDRKLVY